MTPRDFRQRVPRPATIAKGVPPSWAGLPAERRASVPFDRFVAALAGPAPEPSVDGVSAAVLVPVFAGTSGEATVVCIRRASHLQRDPGHVAFPGGRVEPGEPPQIAALREAEEEIGLSRQAVTIHGLLDIVSQSSSGDRIAAFLGLLASPPRLVPNASEVDSVFEIPVARLLSDGVAWREEWGEGPRRHTVSFFADPGVLHDDLIWGVSAGILWRVLDRVAAQA